MPARPDGQVLILVALALPVLVAFLALAADSGNFYLARRISQNAADAGALAGAVELCIQDATAAQIRASAEAYALCNGADRIAVEVGEVAVSVEVFTTRPTIFLGLAGMDHFEVGASATAGCDADAQVVLTR